MSDSFRASCKSRHFCTPEEYNIYSYSDLKQRAPEECHMSGR
jgi:hypothetical protein